MGDDRGQQPGPGGPPARRSATGSAVLTPPTGVPLMPVDVRVFDGSGGPTAPTPASEAVVVPLPRPAAPPRPAPLTRAAPPRRAEPVVPDAAVAVCLCGHGPELHEHWRRGTDCSTCGAGSCTAYRPRGGRFRRLLRRIGLIR